MAQTNVGGNETPSGGKRVVFDKNLGVYIYIDESGNVTQIKKSKKTIEMYYPNATSKSDEVDPGEPVVIGILYDNSMYNGAIPPNSHYVYDENNLQTGTALGIGDEGGGTMARAIY